MPIPESFEAFIEEGQRLRGWITNAYAQIEFQLGDLILRCKGSPYKIETATFTHSATKRASKVRNMAQKAGPLIRLPAICFQSSTALRKGMKHATFWRMASVDTFIPLAAMQASSSKNGIANLIATTRG